MNEKEMQEKIEWIRSQKVDKDENYHSYIEKIEREYQQGTKTKRGNKMKRFIICAIVAFTISCTAACCGFSEAEAGQEEMFVEVYEGRSYSVVYHAETKVMYVAGDVKYGDVFTVLVNPDGTPMVWRE